MRFSTVFIAGLAFKLFASAMPTPGTFEAESNQLVRRIGHERGSETAGVQAYDQVAKRGNTWTNE
jgi:hypothetical protein